MRYILSAVLASAAFALPAQAEPNLERGFDGALHGAVVYYVVRSCAAEAVLPIRRIHRAG
jgi:hypothetical protein